jgi:hypothetical protein
MKQLATVLAALLAATTLHAAAPDRFVQKVRLSSELIAVVAEGDFEARSIGSFSVRLYSSRNALPGDDTTFFITGSIRERAGFIERVELADVDTDGQGEIIVIVRAAGSGGYLSAHAFAYGKQKLVLLASVADLAHDADPVLALKNAWRNRK